MDPTSKDGVFCDKGTKRARMTAAWASKSGMASKVTPYDSVGQASRAMLRFDAATAAVEHATYTDRRPSRPDEFISSDSCGFSLVGVRPLTFVRGLEAV